MNTRVRTLPSMCLWIAQEAADLARIQWHGRIPRHTARAAIKRSITIEMGLDGYRLEDYQLIMGAIVERALDTLYGTIERKDDMTILGWTSPEEVKELREQLATAQQTLESAIAAHLEEENVLRDEITLRQAEIARIDQNAEEHVKRIAELEKTLASLDGQLARMMTLANERQARINELETLLSQQTRRDGRTTPPRGVPPREKGER